MCGVLIICADRACTKGKRNFNYRGVFRLPCVKGFAIVRSTLAGVAETGSETAQRLEGFASVRSTLAGLAERGCKKTIPHRLRRSSLYTREPEKLPDY